MNAAQHATKILDAWRIQDGPGLGAALNVASSCLTQPASRLETERSEVLDSIIDHLRALESNDHVRALSKSTGAAALLLHLSLDARGTRAEDLGIPAASKNN